MRRPARLPGTTRITSSRSKMPPRGVPAYQNVNRRRQRRLAPIQKHPCNRHRFQSK